MFAGSITAGYEASSLRSGEAFCREDAWNIKSLVRLDSAEQGIHGEGCEAAVRLTGSKVGNMAGLLFFEDRSATLGRKHQINSPNVEELTGTIYLSRGELVIDPNDTVAEGSAYTAIIAYKMQLKEGPELIMNSDYGATDVPVPEGIRSATQIFLSD